MSDKKAGSHPPRITIYGNNNGITSAAVSVFHFVMSFMLLQGLVGVNNSKMSVVTSIWTKKGNVL